jgi:anaerobic selenocysteine-containing dehydrogenase
LLNVIVGAIDVPGGCLGSSPAGPFWSPQIGEDGLIVPGYVTLPHPYPARQVRPPQSYILEELFPIACETSHIFVETIRNPEKYKFSYKPEILIHYYCNAMKNTGNPEMVADALKKIPFQMSISLWIDETAEFADIIFPDTSYLERLDPFPNVHTAWVPVGLDNPHTWQLRKPVVDPPEGVRPAVETLFEIAERVGFLSDYYAIFNEASFSGTKIPLKEQYKLDPSKKYSWEEIVDRQAKSMFGEEHGLEWFKEHGLITIPKKVSDIYMPFGKAKIQIYFEYLRRVGEEVDKVTKECGIDWDISDYTPLVDWKPCPAYEPDGEYNLFAVNYKTVYHTFAATQNNAWLEEVAEDDPYAYKIMIHREVAKKRGIKDNDIVSVESKWGGVKGRAVITDFIYPEAIGIAGSYGSWVASGKGVDYNRLIPIDLEHTDYVSCNIDLCVRVKLSKI